MFRGNLLKPAQSKGNRGTPLRCIGSATLGNRSLNDSKQGFGENRLPTG
jgi:hypothetical protein